MRVLVTGATGYVGSRLVTALLKAGHQVLAATRNPHRPVGNLVESTAYPMRASDTRLSGMVTDPPGGPVTNGDGIARALARRPPRPVDALADPRHLADTDPVWAGGDTLRIRRLTGTLTPPTLRPVEAIPRPIAGAIRTGLDTLINLTPRGSTA